MLGAIKSLSALTVALIVSILVVVLIAFVGVYVNGWFTDTTANRQGETQKKHLIEGNGAYRIAAYDHFFDLCASVQTAETAIANTEADLATTTDEGRKEQLQANLSAQKNSRAETINTYNADSSKTYTLAQFKSSNLPYTLFISTKETLCHA